jgi:pyrimidine operon attenuation protein/uracil phosphoribosyltransferase
MSKNIILTNQEIEHTIKRIAYQIYETFVDEQEIVIAEQLTVLYLQKK